MRYPERMTSPRTIATDRFGLGARPGDRVGSDPRAWLAEQLRRYEPRPPALARLPLRAEQIGDYVEFRDMRQARRRSGRDESDAARARRQRRNAGVRDSLVEAANLRLQMAAETDTPFAERLVHFWSNHFAISLDSLQPAMLGADFEYTAIRPNILGNFRDLAWAAIGHPAMLIYLDQSRSVGPGSAAVERANERARNRQFGLNENLAREVLELHTLGVRGGYSQADVGELARALTGWTVSELVGARIQNFIDAPAGEPFFARALHEPGERSVLGKRYRDNGAGQARAIVADLAIHPSTANHVATKLVRHFIADEPPPAAVSRIERAFLASEGDLAAVYRALIEEPLVWSAPREKFRTPWEWYVATLRATGIRPQPLDNPAPQRLLEMLGQPTWRPGSPAGWGDGDAEWASPSALLTRVELANRIGTRMGDGLDPGQTARAALGDALRPATADAVAGAEAPGFGLALFLASPEFLRR